MTDTLQSITRCCICSSPNVMAYEDLHDDETGRCIRCMMDWIRRRQIGDMRADPGSFAQEFERLLRLADDDEYVTLDATASRMAYRDGTSQTNLKFTAYSERYGAFKASSPRTAVTLYEEARAKRPQAALLAVDVVGATAA